MSISITDIINWNNVSDKDLYYLQTKISNEIAIRKGNSQQKTYDLGKIWPNLEKESGKIEIIHMDYPYFTFSITPLFKIFDQSKQFSFLHKNDDDLYLKPPFTVEMKYDESGRHRFCINLNCSDECYEEDDHVYSFISENGKMVPESNNILPNDIMKIPMINDLFSNYNEILNEIFK